jgi:tetratricopeptide (TPR) repeat protein
MDVSNRSIALYGRFSPGARERLERAVLAGGGAVARDLTRRGHMLVIGALADRLIDSGALDQRLRAAGERELPVLGEAAFAAALAGKPTHDAGTLPLATALANTALTEGDAQVLAAFDLIALAGGACRFGDAQVLRTAAALIAAGRSLGQAVRILTEARALSPRGRHKIVLTPSGEAALQWADGLTTLGGQGVLAFDEAHAGLEDLFEAAALAEAARLYDLCAHVDRKDPIAPYNLGNIRLAQNDFDQAALAYRQALARDPAFIEARYNLAQALEAAVRPEGAAAELAAVLAADPTHSDALFNLAQLNMRAGQMSEAKALYERYLALGPPDDWARTARKAIQVCTAG